MNASATALAVALGLAGVAAAAGVLTPAPWRARLSGTLVAFSGAAGIWAGVASLSGDGWAQTLPNLLPMAGMKLAADGLSGWFLLLVGAVTAVAGGYAIGYAGRDGSGSGARAAMAVLPLFTAAMLLVPVAASVATFLVAWELMAVASLVLLLAEHRHQPLVRAAATWYAAMTQAGFVAVLIGLLWLAAASGDNDGDFAAIRGTELPASARNGVFLLCLIGFASKAGAVPLHPWLPRAHAEAPSHVSALMSAAMVKLGIYAILRLGFDLLGGGPAWWWLLVAVLGALSALYGIVQAAVAIDLKRLLAFSTCENVGLILLGIGFGGMLATSGQVDVAALALAAALLHTLNHAGFKALLFLSAGSVVRATGTRNLDRLGGLSRRMPATTLLFAAGALAAAALPPSNGFISEWLLLQSLLHPNARPDVMLAIAAPAGVAVIALTAGIGVAAYVKAVGTGFLARPRSDAAAAAREAPASMVTAMVGAAALCAVLAVLPSLTAAAMSHVTHALRIDASPVEENPLALRAAGVASALSPLWLAIAVVAGTGTIAWLARRLGRGRRRAPAWACGGGPATARMEYTATSYAEPLQRVLDDALAPERDVDVTHHVESTYHVEAMQFRLRIPDRIENRLYRPILDAVKRIGSAARALAPGGVHRYLAYLLVALVAVLLAGVLR